MDSMLRAERGGVYEWESGENKNLCVVVSAPHRNHDRLISILFFSTPRHGMSDDAIYFDFNMQSYCVRTDLVTYTCRKYLKQKVGDMSVDIMKTIDENIMHGLGLKRDDIDWERMYNGLLDSVMKRGY